MNLSRANAMHYFSHSIILALFWMCTCQRNAVQLIKCLFPFILLPQWHQTNLPWCSEESSIPCFVPCNQQLRINIRGNKRLKSLCPSMVSCYYPNFLRLCCCFSLFTLFYGCTTHSICPNSDHINSLFLAM